MEFQGIYIYIMSPIFTNQMVINFKQRLKFKHLGGNLASIFSQEKFVSGADTHHDSEA